MKTAETYNRELLDFIRNHPSGYHVAAGQKALLEAAGYRELKEKDAWDIRPGGSPFLMVPQDRPDRLW